MKRPASAVAKCASSANTKHTKTMHKERSFCMGGCGGSDHGSECLVNLQVHLDEVSFDFGAKVAAFAQKMTMADEIIRKHGCGGLPEEQYVEDFGEVLGGDHVKILRGEQDVKAELKGHIHSNLHSFLDARENYLEDRELAAARSKCDKILDAFSGKNNDYSDVSAISACVTKWRDAGEKTWRKAPKFSGEYPDSEPLLHSESEEDLVQSDAEGDASDSDGPGYWCSIERTASLCMRVKSGQCCSLMVRKSYLFMYI